ncbi:hypothetical protein RSC2_02963 [Bacillus paralicheniformis]|uniref:hypothetical protein n=1 Tax=Bacillus paralicheniformis TaxID=1648923 RepID=UPI001BB449FB|nr:hypothetical protein [Bacillus paralicheniformis]BCE11167.1 hypothetical protein RSC2_02963 [Bacillus paralicheniformis]BCE12740.1 hypothetical protein RSC3_00096 [Bacillus paralicheniformis]
MVQEIFQRVEEVNIIYQFIAVFIIGFVPFLEAFVAVPIGILLGLPFILVVLVGATANWLSVMAVIVFSSFMRSWFSKKKRITLIITLTDVFKKQSHTSISTEFPGSHFWVL